MLNVLFELDNVLRGASMAPPALATRDWRDLRLCDPNASRAHLQCHSPDSMCLCRQRSPLSSHNSDGTCCTTPGGMSLVPMSFITQNNHRSACSFGWKYGLGCSCFSLMHVLRLLFYVFVVFSVKCFYYNELF